MTPAGTFSIEDRIIAKGQGLLVVGQVISGNFVIGQRMHFKVGERAFSLRIKSLTSINHKDRKSIHLIGLAFVYNNGEEKRFLEITPIPKQIALITEDQ